MIRLADLALLRMGWYLRVRAHTIVFGIGLGTYAEAKSGLTRELWKCADSAAQKFGTVAIVGEAEPHDTLDSTTFTFARFRLPAGRHISACKQ